MSLMLSNLQNRNLFKKTAEQKHFTKSFYNPFDFYIFERLRGCLSCSRIYKLETLFKKTA